MGFVEQQSQGLARYLLRSDGTSLAFVSVP